AERDSRSCGLGAAARYCLGHRRRREGRPENRTARRFWVVLRPLLPGSDPEYRPFERRDAEGVHCARSGLSQSAGLQNLAGDDTSDLPDQFRTPRALHNANRFEPGTAGHKNRQRYGYVSECARRAPVSFPERQRPAAGHTVLVGAAPRTDGGTHLPICLGWTFSAEPVDYQFQHPRRSETVSVRLLLFELRQQ